jgi:ELWxxDGT repeat protein/VCBS repeat-containing protein
MKTARAPYRLVSRRRPTRLRVDSLEDRAVPTAALYFQARDLRNVEDGGTGTELYSFDGVNATRTADIFTGPATGTPNSSGPSDPVVFKGKLVFAASNTAFGGSTGQGRELWSFDGTNTVRLTDINPGTADANPNGMTVFNGKLYFAATQAGDTELWAYDGTTASRVADIDTAGSSTPANFTVLGNKLYFGATTGSGNELWAYDGVAAPALVGDLLPGADSGFSGQMIPFEGRLYFSGANNMTGGTVSMPNVELFSYDPATTSFHKASELFGTGTSGFAGEKIAYNGKIYFSALNPSDGFEVFAHDPTNPAANATQITNAAGASNTGTTPTNFTLFNGNLYFSGIIDGISFERELVYYNGTSVTTIQVEAGTNGSSPSNLFAFNNKLYFSANPGDGFGRELYELTPANAFARKTDINPGAGSGSPQEFAVFDPDAASTNAADDAFGTDKDRTRALNVLANDSDPDNDPLAINQVNGTAVTVGVPRTLPSGARLTLNANKTFTYDPNGAFAGLAVGATTTDTFTYRVTDGTNQDTATVTMTISNLADVPVNTFADTIDADPTVTR